MFRVVFSRSIYSAWCIILYLNFAHTLMTHACVQPPGRLHAVFATRCVTYTYTYVVRLGQGGARALSSRTYTPARTRLFPRFFQISTTLQDAHVMCDVLQITIRGECHPPTCVIARRESQHAFSGDSSQIFVCTSDGENMRGVSNLQR